jgi:hypothetical protein
MKLIRELIEETEILTEDINGKKEYFLYGPMLRSNVQNANKRSYPRHILENEYKNYENAYIKKNRALGELGHPACIVFTDTAKLLTETGWKLLKDVSDNERILTRNYKGDIEVNKITNKIKQHYKGKMINLKGRNIDVLVTPNHRFPTNKGFITAQEIFDNEKLSKQYLFKTAEYDGPDIKLYTLPSVPYEHFIKLNKKLKEKYSSTLIFDMKIWMAFLGLFLSEGNTSNKKYNINVTQTKKENIEKIDKLFSHFPKEVVINRYSKNNKVTWSIGDIRIYNVLKPLGLHYEKYIPQTFKNLSIPYLEELLEWFILGDGRIYVDKNNFNYVKTDLFSTSEKLIDDLHEILIKCGGCGNRHTEICKKDYKFAGRIIKAENKLPLHFLKISTTKNIWLDKRFLNVEEVDFDGKIFCVTVPNETFYFMDNGKSFWSGNSPTINLPLVSHMITEGKQDGDTWTGKAKILNTPNGSIVKGFIDEGVLLGFSSRGVGSLKLNKATGINEVQEDFKLFTMADIVANPSAPDCFATGLMESADWIFENGHWKEIVLENAVKSLKKDGSTKNQLKIFEEFISNINFHK